MIYQIYRIGKIHRDKVHVAWYQGIGGGKMNVWGWLFNDFFWGGKQFWN